MGNAGYVSLSPSTMLNPTPVVLVSCAEKDNPENRDMVTVAWAGTVCSDPAMLSISIRPERYSYDIIKRTKEFAVNLTTASLVPALDHCGVCSGRDHDKFAETGN